MNRQLITYKSLLPVQTNPTTSVTTALKEYIARKKQIEVIDLFGKIVFDKNYDYKKARTA